MILNKSFEGPLFQYMITRRWNIVNTLLAWGVDPHFVHLSHRYSPVPESALSLAMYSSGIFWGFRNALRKMYPNGEDIARQELKEGRPLLGAGWRIETLTALLELDFKPSVKTYAGLLCDSCSGGTLGEVRVQTSWQNILENIKNGIHLQSFCSDTQEEQSSNSEGHPAISKQDSLTNATDGSSVGNGAPTNCSTNS